jgi:hypothetical protein
LDGRVAPWQFTDSTAPEVVFPAKQRLGQWHATKKRAGEGSRDVGNLLNAAMPASPGFASGDPTPLLFIQTTEDQIEGAMDYSGLGKLDHDFRSDFG